MATRKLPSPVYTHLQSVLNRALPLEYAIRAMKTHEPQVFKKLLQIDSEIRSFWSGQGWSIAEISQTQVVDMSWDGLQSAYIMVRSHGKIYPCAKKMREGIEEICRLYIDQFNAVQSVFLDHFRVCDLVSGNDIPTLLRKVAQAMGEAFRLANNPEIPGSSFLLGVREGLRLQPRVAIAADEIVTKPDGKQDALFLALPYCLTLDELKEAVNEFLYRYAIDREIRSTQGDGVSRTVIGSLLNADLHALPADAAVATYQMAIGPIRGLLCWDLRQQYVEQKGAAPRKHATEEAHRLHVELIPSRPPPEQQTFVDDLKKVSRKINEVLPKLLNRSV